jgi:lipoyl(octanoyl) transferase
MHAPNQADTHTVIVRDLGLVDYLPTWRAMQDFNAQRAPATGDELWLLQHPPVYTLGLNTHQAVLDNPTRIPVVRCDRGGDISYHGPGQLVAYVLMDLRRRGWGVQQLVHALEQSVIDFLRERAIEAERRTGAPGVYVNAKKIAQLGLRIRQGTSYHGLAFNIDMDLEPFRRIAPCGIQGLEVTQLAALLPREEKLFALAAAGLRTHLLHHLGYNAAPTPSPGPA